jgi:hypothetical protein
MDNPCSVAGEPPRLSLDRESGQMHAPPPFFAEDSKAFSMDEVGLGSNDFPDPSL